MLSKYKKITKIKNMRLNIRLIEYKMKLSTQIIFNPHFLIIHLLSKEFNKINKMTYQNKNNLIKC